MWPDDSASATAAAYFSAVQSNLCSFPFAKRISKRDNAPDVQPNLDATFVCSLPVNPFISGQRFTAIKTVICWMRPPIFASSNLLRCVPRHSSDSYHKSHQRLRVSGGCLLRLEIKFSLIRVIIISPQRGDDTLETNAKFTCETSLRLIMRLRLFEQPSILFFLD